MKFWSDKLYVGPTQRTFTYTFTYTDCVSNGKLGTFLLRGVQNLWQWVWQMGVSETGD